jgi:serine-type D-Ala-D-Ala carboxypeptidase/endopeptidase (penicillin-binding protein 4)
MPPENSPLSPVGQTGLCPQQLPLAIDRIIQQPTYRTARWSIQVESLVDQTVLYSHNPTDFLIPASNIKLFTTAAALQSVHPEQRWNNFDSQIDIINRNSNNAYADAMLQRIGGPKIVQTQLADLGISPQLYQQVDGSGLSRQNFTNAATLVTLLKAMRWVPEAQRFYASLPIAALNGTLQNRFVNTALAGRVHAKTGTLTGVRALSGYLEHPLYGSIVFSILVNQPQQSDSLRRAIDEIVVTLGQLTPCDTTATTHH